MRRSLLFILFATLVTPWGLAAQDAKTEFQRLETVWNRAHLIGDADALARLWHDDLVVIVPRMAPMSRAEALAFARSGRMQFERYETSELSVRTYGSTALVSGHLRRTRILNGRPVDDDWRFTKVYLHNRHGWRVVSFQASESLAP